MKTIDQHIEEVMDWFEFDVVHKHMEAVGWEWHSSDGVPTVADLRKHVRDAMRGMYERKEERYECGGFVINYHNGIDESGPWDNFRVYFAIASWYTGE